MNKKDLKYLFLIILTFIAACIETDIYLPAFPDMMEYFKTSEEVIQSLLTWNFIGICLSGPFYGPLSDAYGRKKPLLIALGLFSIGSLVTLIATSFDLMLVGRVLQGLGSGGCFTLGTAIIFDVFKKEKATEAINQLNTFVPLIMAGAPLLGGYLNENYGFRSNFLTIAIFVVLSFVISLFFLDETLPKKNQKPFSLSQTLTDFKTAFSNLRFWQLTICISLLFGGYLAFVSVSSILFILELGVSKSVFPFYQGSVLGAYVLASLTCSPMIRKWGVLKVKKTGVMSVFFGGFGLGIVSLVNPNSPLLLTSMMMIYSFGCSWIMAPYFGECMEILPEIRGITASLLTSFRLLATAILIGISSAFYDQTIYPVAILIAIVLCLTLPTLRFYEKKVRK